MNRIFQILLCWAKNFPVGTAATLIDLSEKTVTLYYQKFRKRAAAIIKAEASLYKFTESVQIDESLFAKRKFNRGKMIKQKWVFGVCEGKTQGRVYLTYVKDRSQKTLIAKIQKLIDVKAIINSDSWASYKPLRKLGFVHNAVNHSEYFVDPVTGAHTQRIECLWGVCKKWLRNHNYHHSDHLQDYLYEWCFKYNCHCDLKTIITSILRFKINRDYFFCDQNSFRPDFHCKY
jgi:transposase-like protein